ncbi:MAG TPA: DUF3352 domain-containing protein [Thermoleophilaceae bacterium]|nr:DUF3352 domain-containing protein [Thermoleophilaceae bacterium]
MRKLILTLLVLSASVFAATACGSEDEAASGASELVPASAVFYGEVTLKPEGEQKEAIDAILARFPGGGQAGDKLKELIDKALRESDAPVSFSKDIEPWLGDEAAFFASGGNAGDFRAGAALVATEDEDAALETVEKTGEGEISRKTYKDVEYMTDESEEAAAVFDGFVVLGSEAGVKAVIDTREGGEKLSDAEGFQNALDEAAEDRLGLFFVNSPALQASLQRAGAPMPDSLERLFREPFVATLDADRDGVTFEGSVPEDLGRASFFGQASDLLTELPADSWVATAQTDFGQTLDFLVGAFAGAVGGRDTIEQQFKAATGLDLQEDVIDWMGDFGVFVRGESVSELNGALVIETKDEAASGRFLDGIERLARTQGGGEVQIAPRGGGFTATVQGVPQPIHAFQDGGRVVFAYGERAASDAADPSETLGDAPEFAEARDSLGDYEVSMFLLMQPIFDLVDSSESANDADWQEAKPYLEPLDALIGGTSGEGGDLRSAFKLIVK